MRPGIGSRGRIEIRRRAAARHIRWTPPELHKLLPYHVFGTFEAKIEDAAKLCFQWLSPADAACKVHPMYVYVHYMYASVFQAGSALPFVGGPARLWKSISPRANHVREGGARPRICSRRRGVERVGERSGGGVSERGLDLQETQRADGSVTRAAGVGFRCSQRRPGGV